MTCLMMFPFMLSQLMENNMNLQQVNAVIVFGIFISINFN